jgi:uncharacterized membrane protein YdjX (TVP38/TMEM64 family)
MSKLFFGWLALGCLILLFILFFYFDLYQYLSFNALQQYRQQLLNLTQHHYFLMVISFIFVYTLAVAVSIPGAVFLTLTGGFLFGIILGTLYVVTGATLGAIVLFMVVKTVLGHWIAARASAWIAKLEKGFQKNAFNYLLTLRLIPIFPFWLVNIVPALLNIPLRTFVFATMLGIIPGSLVYVMLGNSLGYIFDRGQTADLNLILQPQILIPLLSLAVFSLLPIVYKYFKKKQHE